MGGKRVNEAVAEVLEELCARSLAPEYWSHLLFNLRRCEEQLASQPQIAPAVPGRHWDRRSHGQRVVPDKEDEGVRRDGSLTGGIASLRRHVFIPCL